MPIALRRQLAADPDVVATSRTPLSMPIRGAVISLSREGIFLGRSF